MLVTADCSKQQITLNLKMGKFFTVVDGKDHDWKFTKSKVHSDKYPAWDFYLGDTYIGYILKAQLKGWDPYVLHTCCPFGGLRGFATRYDAANYMLRVCGFLSSDNQSYAPSGNWRFKTVPLEEYLDLVDSSLKLEDVEKKLKAAKAKVQSLQSLILWTENPEGMGR